MLFKTICGEEIVVYLSLWSMLFHVGVSGLVSDCGMAGFELKRKNRVEHINIGKIYCFRVYRVKYNANGHSDVNAH